MHSEFLMYVARPSDVPYTIADIAMGLTCIPKPFSENRSLHGKTALDLTIRGKGGGLRFKSRRPKV